MRIAKAAVLVLVTWLGIQVADAHTPKVYKSKELTADPTQLEECLLKIKARLRKDKSVLTSIRHGASGCYQGVYFRAPVCYRMRWTMVASHGVQDGRNPLAREVVVLARIPEV